MHEPSCGPDVGLALMAGLEFTIETGIDRPVREVFAHVTDADKLAAEAHVLAEDVDGEAVAAYHHAGAPRAGSHAGHELPSRARAAGCATPGRP